MTNFNTYETDFFFSFINSVKKQNPVLSQEELAFLSEKANSGDLKARDKIVLSNFGLIEKIAYECNIPNVSMEDKFFAGVEGFLKTVQSYNYNKCPFLSSYIWFPVKYHIFKKLLGDMPISLYKTSTKIMKARAELANDLDREPKTSELAEYLGMEEKKLAKQLQKIREYDSISLDGFTEDESDSKKNLLNYIGATSTSPKSFEDEIIEREIAASIKKALARLSDEDRELIYLSTGYGNSNGKKLTLRAIGTMKGVTHQAIAYRYTQAKKRFMKYLDEYDVC